MTDTNPMREALAGLIARAYVAVSLIDSRDTDDPEQWTENARQWVEDVRDYVRPLNAALAAAPQPAPVDREALVEVIREAWQSHCNGGNLGSGTGLHAIADALLARGLRLPAPETMAWAVVGEDGKIDPRKLWINSRDAEEYCERGERSVRVAIRVVEGGNDA